LVGDFVFSPHNCKQNFTRSATVPTGVSRSPCPANFHKPTAIFRSAFANLLYVLEATFFEQPLNLAMPSMNEILPSGVRRHSLKLSSLHLVFASVVTEGELIIPTYASDIKIFDESSHITRNHHHTPRITIY